MNWNAESWGLDADARWWLVLLVVKGLVAVGLVVVLK